MDEFDKVIRLTIMKICEYEVLTELVQYRHRHVADKTRFDLTTDDIQILRGIV